MTVMKLDERLRVSPSPPLMADLKALLGPSCRRVRVLGRPTQQPCGLQAGPDPDIDSRRGNRGR